MRLVHSFHFNSEGIGFYDNSTTASYHITYYYYYCYFLLLFLLNFHQLMT